MPFVKVPGVFEITVKGINSSQPWVNVFHVATDEFASPTPASIAAKCAPAFIDNFKTLMNTSCSISSVAARDLSEQFGEQSIYIPPGGFVVGSKAGEGYSAQVAVLVQKRTTLVGRANRGRMYVPGLVETDIQNSSGALVAASLTAWQAAANAWRAATNGTIDTANINLCVARRYQGIDAQGKPIPRPQGIFRLVDSGPVSPYVATQRDRLKR